MNTINVMRQRYTESTWLRRLGAASFTFFLLKGLLWLAAPIFFYLAV